MFIQDNTDIYMDTINASNIERIPVGNWVVKFHPKQGKFYLSKTKEFNIPTKMYGDVKETTEKYLKSFNHYDKNLGILLSGMKGTGKSMLARHIAHTSNLPVLIISEGYGGTEFNQFLASIQQECVILLDEFEKVYREVEDQQHLLSVLDGVFPTKFLFLLTINEVSKMDQFFMNRPGRIHYAKHYGGLEDEIIRMVCEDMLDDQGKADSIVKVCNFLGDVSMDIITSVIKECNLYPDESPSALVQSMNLVPEEANFSVAVYLNGELVKGDASFSENPYGMSPENNFDVSWYGDSLFSLMPENNKQWVTVNYSHGYSENLKVDITNKTMVMEFVNPNIEYQIPTLEFPDKPFNRKTNRVMDYDYDHRDVNVKLVFSKSKRKVYNYGAF
jgi:hypothetical protein